MNDGLRMVCSAKKMKSNPLAGKCASAFECINVVQRARALHALNSCRQNMASDAMLDEIKTYSCTLGFCIVIDALHRKTTYLHRSYVCMRLYASSSVCYSRQL